MMRSGKPVEVTGLAAVAVWVHNALSTQKYCHEMHGFGYGSALLELTGQSWSSDTKEAEIHRLVEACLIQSPYILGASVENIVQNVDMLCFDVRVRTIYGEEIVHV